MIYTFFSASKSGELKVGEKFPFWGDRFPQFFTKTYDLTVVKKEEAVAKDLALYRDSAHDYYTHSVQEKGKIARGNIMHLEGSKEDLEVWLEQMDVMEEYFGLPRGKESIQRVRQPNTEIERIDCFRALKLDDIPKKLIIGELVRIN